MKKRVVGYDIIKSMAMFFVVMLHYSFYTRFYSSGLAGTAVTVLCVVCVPLFFAVNGALLLPRKMDEAKHYRKTLNIVIVVTIWRLLAAAFFVFVDGSHPVTLKDLVLFLLGGGFGDYPTGYFWFMNALIAVYLVLPVMKMAFDSERKLAFNALLAVLAGFTVGKDSLKLVLQMLGTATNHDFASILNALDEFYIFGSYGYVLLYFLIGGMIGRYLKQKQTGELDADVHHPLFDISWGEASAGIVVCYALTSFVATILILLVLGRVNIQGIWAKVFQVIGMNTFGVYMLHLVGLVLLSRLQALPWLQFMGNLNSVAVTLLNVVLCGCVFAICLAVSVLFRKIPYINRLFAL